MNTWKGIPKGKTSGGKTGFQHPYNDSARKHVKQMPAAHIGTPGKSGFNRVITGKKMLGKFPRNTTRIPYEGV